MKRHQRSSMCCSRAHRKQCCPKRPGHKDVPCPPKENPQVVTVNHSVQSQHRRKRQYCPAVAIPFKGQSQAAMVSANAGKSVCIQNPNGGGGGGERQF